MSFIIQNGECSSASGAAQGLSPGGVTGVSARLKQRGCPLCRWLGSHVERSEMVPRSMPYMEYFLLKLKSQIPVLAGNPWWRGAWRGGGMHM